MEGKTGYKLWHMVVAFVAGAAITFGIGMVPGESGQGFLLTSPSAHEMRVKPDKKPQTAHEMKVEPDIQKPQTGELRAECLGAWESYDELEEQIKTATGELANDYNQLVSVLNDYWLESSMNMLHYYRLQEASEAIPNFYGGPKTTYPGEDFGIDTSYSEAGEAITAIQKISSHINEELVDSEEDSGRYTEFLEHITSFTATMVTSAEKISGTSCQNLSGESSYYDDNETHLPSDYYCYINITDSTSTAEQGDEEDAPTPAVLRDESS